MTIEEIKILTKGKNQDYKDGWNDAVKMCNKEHALPPVLQKLIFGRKGDDYKAGFADAYAELEASLLPILKENQRLREIQKEVEEDKAYVDEKHRELDSLIEKEDFLDKIAKMFVDEGLIDDEYYRKKVYWEEQMGR